MIYHIAESKQRDYVSYSRGRLKKGLRQEHDKVWESHAGTRTEIKKRIFELIFQDYEKKVELITGTPWKQEKCVIGLVFGNKIQAAPDGVEFGYLAPNDLELLKPAFLRALVEFRFRAVKDEKIKRRAVTDIVKTILRQDRKATKAREREKEAARNGWSTRFAKHFRKD